MAYRFNPPPNWPIDDANWSPPPGWQPDPSWGPAPEGWNFWVEAEEAPAESSPADAGAAAEASTDGAAGAAAAAGAGAAAGFSAEAGEGTDPGADSGAGTDAVSDDESSAGVEDDATRMVSTDPVAEGSAPVEDDDATHVADSDQRAAADGEVADDAAVSAETAEYQGPDHQAGLSEQTPYEASAPAYGAAQSSDYGDAQSAEQVPSAGSAAPDYGHGYGQASPAPGYGQGSPAPGYGQGSPAPGVDSGTAWTASTATGEAPPQKSVLQRFWWVGCILIALLLVAVLAIGGGIWLFRSSGDDTAGGGSEDPTTSAEETTTEEAPTEEDEDEPTQEAVTPTDLPTIDPAAEDDAKDWVSMDGAGTVAVQMEYVPGSDLESTYGGEVQEGEFGDYLVVTAKLTVTEGTMDLNPHQFSIKTPYGGEISPSSETYGLAGSGIGGDAPTTFEAGDEYTVKILFDVQRAGGNTLNYTTYSDDYTWDIPA